MLTTFAEIKTAFNEECEKAAAIMGWDIRDEGWKISTNKRKTAVGLCDYRKKTIYVSVYFMETNGIDKLRNTIIHECSHAYTPGAKHGRAWKNLFIRLGGTGDRLNKIVDKSSAKPKYRVVDTRSMKVVAEYYRKPTRDFSQCAIRGDKSSLGYLKVQMKSHNNSWKFV